MSTFRPFFNVCSCPNLTMLRLTCQDSGLDIFGVPLRFAEQVPNLRHLVLSSVEINFEFGPGCSLESLVITAGDPLGVRIAAWDVGLLTHQLDWFHFEEIDDIPPEEHEFVGDVADAVIGRHDMHRHFGEPDIDMRLSQAYFPAAAAAPRSWLDAGFASCTCLARSPWTA